MSCVLTSTVMPRPRRRSSRSSRASRALTSTPVNGSSSRSTCGSCASARARKTRCCCPPERSPTGRAREVGDGELLEAARHDVAVRRLRAPQPAQATVAPHHDDVAHRDREAPVDLLALRHVGDGFAPAPAGRRSRSSMLPPRTGSSPTSALKSVDLPAPFGPDDGDLAAVRHVERDVLQRGAAAVVHGEVRHGEAGVLAHLSASTMSWCRTSSSRCRWAPLRPAA